VAGLAVLENAGETDMAVVVYTTSIDIDEDAVLAEACWLILDVAQG
jgi:hypothetical protein